MYFFVLGRQRVKPRQVQYQLVFCLQELSREELEAKSYEKFFFHLEALQVLIADAGTAASHWFTSGHVIAGSAFGLFPAGLEDCIAIGKLSGNGYMHIERRPHEQVFTLTSFPVLFARVDGEICQVFLDKASC